MAKFSGRNVRVGIGLETVARGTAAAKAYWYPFLEANFQDKDTPLYNESAYGHIMKNSDKITTLISGEGSVTGKLYAKGLYYILALIFGQVATTTEDVGGDTGANSHAFAMLNSNEHLSATLGVKDANSQYEYPFAMIDSVTITWAPDAFPQVEINFMSKKGVADADSVSFIADSEFIPKQAALKLAANLAGLGAAVALTDIKSFSLTFAKTLSPQQTMDSGDTYGSIFNTDLEVTGSIEKLLSDTTYRGYALADTIQAMEFTLTDTVNKAGATTNTSLDFKLSRVAFDSYVANRGTGDLATETLNFAALLDVTTPADTVAATLVNKYDY
jgi:hypothetical protein